MITLASIPLLATRNTELFRSMGSGFRQKQENFNPAEFVFWMLVVVGGFCALGLLSRLLNRRGKRRLYNSPRALFRALCRRHELDASSRRLLRNLAAHHRLSMPAQIFLLPDCFLPEGLSPALQAHAAQLAVLRQQLFGAQHDSDVDTADVNSPDPLALVVNNHETAPAVTSVAVGEEQPAVLTLAVSGARHTALFGEDLDRPFWMQLESCGASRQ